MVPRPAARHRTTLCAVLLGPLVALAGLAPVASATAGPPAAAHVAASGVLDPGLTDATGPQRVVVTGTSVQAAGTAVRSAGGTVTAALPVVDGVAATVPATALRPLAASAGVRAVTADRTGRMVDYSWDETTSASTFSRTTQAATAWARGSYGKGVGVAVLDTGVSPSDDLAGRVVYGPDLSGEGTYVDSYGHGTVMAGLIAGNGALSATRTGGRFTGVAPDAHVVSVKVAGRNGVVDVSTVLQAMHWVSAYREQYGIRVLNLSWGVPSTQSPAVDPVDYAVERLWAQGIVVVVAAGNSGPNNGTVTKPGDDPVVLTVGAYNEGGDTDPSNDGVPGWSSRGPTAQGLAKPDLVAPGRSLVALRSPGSAIETDNPKALVAPAYIRGSGTSQAAAVTSGAVALMLSERPSLTPDEVKARLMDTALPIAGTTATAQGRGRLQIDAALSATTTGTTTGTTQNRAATGLGSLDASRGGYRVVADCGGAQTEIRGEIDVRCQAWDPQAWTGSAWTGDAWTGVAWKGSTWDGVAWKGASWSDATWTGVAWKGGTWTGDSWSGSRGWNGSSVTDSAWTGVAWKGSAWSGVAWKDATWSTGSWTTAAYEELLTAFWGTTPPAGRRLAGEPYTPAGRG